MNYIRTDSRQWLIHEEENVTVGIKAIEIMALTVTGELLSKNEDVEMRAVGNLMMRWADARQRAMMNGMDGEDSTHLEKSAMVLLTDILDWMGGQGEKPEDALEQLHSVAFSFDSTLSGAGITGPGWYRELARGEHGR